MSDESSTLPCSLVSNLTTTLDQCKFVIENDCLKSDTFIDYVHLLYCNFGVELRPLAICLFLFLILILFLGLGALADEFLCPNLLTLAKVMRMSDNLAGITLLALGNGAADNFSSWIAVSDNRSELIVGELLGAGIFCTSIVVGLIFVRVEFDLARRPLLRDALFYALAVFLTWLYCHSQQVTLVGALAFIFIYILYIGVALVSQAIHARGNKNYELSADESFPDEINTSLAEQVNAIKLKTGVVRRPSIVLVGVDADTAAATRQLALVCRKQSLGAVSMHRKLSCASGVFSPPSPPHIVVQSVDLEPETGAGTQPAQTNGITSSCKQHKQESLASIQQEMPLTLKSKLLNIVGGFLNILSAPLFYAALISVPVASFDKPLNGWRQTLNSLHFLLSPLAVLVLLRNLPNTGILLVLTGFGVLFAIFALCVTRSDQTPAFHAPLVACAGFALSVLWIYRLALEMIGLLSTLALIVNMSDTAIGIGALAWCNSLSDVVANTSLAAAGYPRMAIGASIGSPLLNLLIGFGVSFSYHLATAADGNTTAPLKYTPTIALSAATLAVILALLVACAVAPANCGYKLRKPVGYLLMAIYVGYLLGAALLESGGRSSF